MSADAVVDDDDDGISLSSVDAEPVTSTDIDVDVDDLNVPKMPAWVLDTPLTPPVVTGVPIAPYHSPLLVLIHALITAMESAQPGFVERQRELAKRLALCASLDELSSRTDIAGLVLGYFMFCECHVVDDDGGDDDDDVKKKR